MAKRLFISIFKHYLLWILLFAISRIIFLLWNYEEVSKAGIGEILLAFPKAVYLDTAMASYLVVTPFLLTIISFFVQREFILRIGNFIHLILFFLFFLIVIAELSIYDEWHTKLTYKALWFLGSPSEVFHTASWMQLFSGLFGSALLSGFSFWLYKKYIGEKTLPERKPVWIPIAYALIVPALLIIGIRGGFQTIPINMSDAYYSKNNVLNLAATNSAFNLASSCIENANASESYEFLQDDLARKTFDEMHFVVKDTTTRILTTTRPNIVLVVLEGWSADVIKGCGGYDTVTPYFNAMAEQGILFSNCYASGSLSDQGMAAVFSAFPAQPRTSIITQPNKYEHLPCINTVLKDAGYSTSFMFGGQLSYGNIRSYMYFNGFDKIIEGENFSSDIPQGKLGVHDEYLYPRQLQELKKEKQPFFAAMFTMSSHGPYDFKLKTDLNWGGKEEDYINSVYYADNCIRQFIESAKKEAWYKNTLFVFVSDHSHNSPRNWVANQPEYRKIPMLFYGPVIDSLNCGMKYEQITSQTDLASTLLHQLDLPASEFEYSKNLFNPGTKHFAYYAFEEGFGFVEEEQHYVWSVDGRTHFIKANTPADSTRLLLSGQSFLQTLMDRYWKY